MKKRVKVFSQAYKNCYKAYMSDIEKKPSLRISPNVYGRTGEKNRVKYLIDPKGEGTKTGVPETVVLTRWRKRQFPNYSFSGEKLSSTLWRAVAAAYGSNAKKICKLSLEDIQAIKEEKTVAIKAQGHLELPAAKTLQALCLVCGHERMQVLLDKHNSLEHQGKSGVPDLFLYATHIKTGKTSIARFVEVKKPDEKVSQDQKDEIALMNCIGLHARVIRLVEKPTTKCIGKTVKVVKCQGKSIGLIDSILIEKKYVRKLDAGVILKQEDISNAM
jgi:hypothetical protein